MTDDSSTAGDQHVKPIDELDVFEAYEAKERGGTIECPNDCYEPVTINSESIRAASRLSQCEECGSNHLVKWSDS